METVITRMRFLSPEVRNIFSSQINPININQARHDVHVEVIERLLLKEYDLNIAVNQNGYSIIQVATINRHFKVIKLMVEQKAILELTTNKCQQTALEIAKMNGFRELFTILQ